MPGTYKRQNCSFVRVEKTCYLIKRQEEEVSKAYNFEISSLFLGLYVFDKLDLIH
jgi:hypothetical protein